MACVRRETASDPHVYEKAHLFASMTPGFLDQAVFVFGCSALEHMKSLARNSVVGERGCHLLKHRHAMARARLS
jgi:hypothetical protein